MTAWTHDDDMTGKRCKGTKGCKGTYKETSPRDDADRVVHCVKCGHGVKRWKEEPDDVTEGLVKKKRRKPLHRTMIRKKKPKLMKGKPAFGKKSNLRMGDELLRFSDFMAENRSWIKRD